MQVHKTLKGTFLLPSRPVPDHLIDCFWKKACIEPFGDVSRLLVPLYLNFPKITGAARGSLGVLKTSLQAISTGSARGLVSLCQKEEGACVCPRGEAGGFTLGQKYRLPARGWGPWPAASLTLREKGHTQVGWKHPVSTKQEEF